MFGTQSRAKRASYPSIDQTSASQPSVGQASDPIGADAAPLLPASPTVADDPVFHPSHPQDTGALQQIAKVQQVSTLEMTAYVAPDMVCYQPIKDSCKVGTMIKTPLTDGWLFATIQALSLSGEGGFHLTLTYVGAYISGAFRRGIEEFPSPLSPIYTATDDDMRVMYMLAGCDSMRIGTVHPSRSVPASLNIEKLLSRHFSVLGSTGSGKSCTVALMMHRLVASCPEAHVLILDPHNEYAHAFREQGEHFNTDNLSLPYWLMNFEEHVEIFVGRDLRGRASEVDILKYCLYEARKAGAADQALSRLTVDTPIPYKLTDLLRTLDHEIGRLEKAESVKPYLKLRAKIEELRADRRFAFMFSGLLVQDTLHDIVARLLRFPVAGRPVSTLDLSGVPNEIVDVVVSLISRLVFDFAMWNKRSKNSVPILLVCEEAHRYVPHDKKGDQRMQSARKSLERIAKEGRKYGVSLGLVSQRPSDLSEAILSQCGTIISMRMNNERDRRFVENAMPEGAAHFLGLLPSLQNQECLISGEGCLCPTRVKLDTLDTDMQPASEDLHFSGLWRQETLEPKTLVKQTITAWRKAAR